MATLAEHADKISAAIEAARKDGYRLSLEDRDIYEEAYVDLEEYGSDDGGKPRLIDWTLIIASFDG